jgi:hypothetical protein
VSIAEHQGIDLAEAPKVVSGEDGKTVALEFRFSEPPPTEWRDAFRPYLPDARRVFDGAVLRVWLTPTAMHNARLLLDEVVRATLNANLILEQARRRSRAEPPEEVEDLKRLAQRWWQERWPREKGKPVEGRGTASPEAD